MFNFNQKYKRLGINYYILSIINKQFNNAIFFIINNPTFLLIKIDFVKMAILSWN